MRQIVFLSIFLMTTLSFASDLQEALMGNSWCRKRFSGNLQTIKMDFAQSGYYQSLVIENDEVVLALRGTWRLTDNFLELWRGLEYSQANIQIWKKYDIPQMEVTEKDKYGSTKIFKFNSCD